MIETRRRHLTVVRSGGKTVGRDAITLPAPGSYAYVTGAADR
jgi:hypothetical protein